MLRLEGSRLILDGEVTLASHTRLREASECCLDKHDLEVDWSAVTDVDSSALSLVFHWERELGRSGHRLTHRQMPAGLHALAELYGVQDLLGGGV